MLVRLLTVLFAIAFLRALAPAAESTSETSSAAPWDRVATFSILGYDPDTGEIGGAVQSRVFCVGNGVLWAEAGVGAVATQAVVDIGYGPAALKLLKEGAGRYREESLGRRSRPEAARLVETGAPIRGYQR